MTSPLARRRDPRTGSGSEVVFNAVGGPLVCVCGLAGGVGTTTLAYLLAVSAARRSDAPVLACDGGGPTAALSDVAAASSRRSLPELAELTEAGQGISHQVFVRNGRGVRLIATEPRFRPAAAGREALAAVLADARAAHGLTIVDCGTLQREPEQTALEQATHVAWVAPETEAGARRGLRALDLVQPCDGRELLLAARPRLRERGYLLTLKRLASSRCAPLILFPPASVLAAAGPDAALELAQTAVAALEAELTR